MATNQGAVSSSVGMSDPLVSSPICVKSLRLAGNAAIGDDNTTWQLGPDRNGNNLSGGNLDGQGYSLTKIGNNTLVLEVRNVTPLSQFTIANGGIIYCNTGVSPIGSSVPIVISNNAWMDSWDNYAAPEGIFVTNNITIGTGGGQLWNTLNAQGGGTACHNIYYGNLLLNGDLSILNTSYYNNVYGQMTFAGVISGTGGIFIAGNPDNSLGDGIQGANYVVFEGNNTYNGLTTVSNMVQLFTTTANQSGGAYDVVDYGTLDVALTNGNPTLPMSSLTFDQQTSGPGNVSFSRISFPSATTPIIYATNLAINSGNIIPPATNYAVGEFPLIQYRGRSVEPAASPPCSLIPVRCRPMSRRC